MSDLAATATATAGWPCHYVQEYTTSLATTLATAEAVAVATHLDSVYCVCITVLTVYNQYCAN